jgi:hypothetical protein
MKKFIGFLLILIVVDGFSQKSPEKRHQRSKLIINDSIAVRLQRLRDSMIQVKPQTDSLVISNSIRNNADYFLQLQKKQNAKQKKSALIYIGIGLTLLIVLFIGLMRKRQKNNLIRYKLSLF